MKGVKFGNYHSYDDLHLILNSKEIGSPNVKVKKIDVEGADSSIDYTDFFGGPKYEDVTHKFQFSTIVPQDQFLSLFSDVKNKLHGKKMKIILDEDPSFYYVGRVYVSNFTNEKNVGILSIETDCEPYKYKTEKTVISMAINGADTITIENGRKRAVPEITASAPLTVVLADGAWYVDEGTITIPELEFSEGENIVTVTGVGDITFTYQEANL